eukprot:4613952-Amphidinium_carterae.1
MALRMLSQSRISVEQAVEKCLGIQVQKNQGYLSAFLLESRARTERPPVYVTTSMDLNISFGFGSGVQRKKGGANATTRFEPKLWQVESKDAVRD